MQRAIKSIRVNYVSATGEELSLERAVSKAYPRIRTRLCGGAGGMFRVYLDKENGELSTIMIKQDSITNVTIIHSVQEKK